MTQANRGSTIAQARTSVSPPDLKSAHEAARFVATVSLSLGALMLSLFGIVERMVSFERLQVENELAIIALLPGIATLSFIACARAVSWLISHMGFDHWHGTLPQQRWDELRRQIDHPTQWRFRLTMMAGAYAIFTLVISVLAGTSAALAFGLSAPELRAPSLAIALLAGAATVALVLYEMLTRDRPNKSAMTAIYIALLVAVLVVDVLL